MKMLNRFWLFKEPESLRKRTILGVVWANIGQFGSQVIHFLTLIVLAWILEPADFGLLTQVMVFILIVENLGTGLAAPIVQRSNITDITLDTAFWSNLVIGIILSVFTMLGAESIARILGNVETIPLLRIMSALFVIPALSMVPRALLEKDINFRRLTIRQFVGEISYGITGITMGLLGFGIWSLVGAVFAQRLGGTVALWFSVPWRPSFNFSISEFKRLWGFGIYSVSSDMLVVSMANADYFIIGRWLGTEALGFYTLAFQLALVPQKRLVGILRRVWFPAFSRVNRKLESLRKGFQDGSKYLFFTLTPISFFVASLAPWLIMAIYDERWLPVISPLRILTIAGFFYGFEVAESLYYAIGKPKYRVWILGTRFIIFVVLVALFGISRGINGIAFCLTLSFATTSIFGYVIVSREIDLSFLKLLRPVLAAVAAVFLACVPVIIAGAAIDYKISPWVFLGVSLPIMSLIYLVALMRFSPGTIDRFIGMFIQSLKIKSQGYRSK